MREPCAVNSWWSDGWRALSGCSSELVLFSLEAIAFDPRAQLPQCGVIHLRQMIGPLLHDQLQVVWIVDGLIYCQDN